MNGLAGSPLLVGGLGPGPLLPTTKSGREAAQDRGRSLLSTTACSAWIPGTTVTELAVWKSVFKSVAFALFLTQTDSPGGITGPTDEI